MFLFYNYCMNIFILQSKIKSLIETKIKGFNIKKILVLLVFLFISITLAQAEDVVYNPNTKIYHNIYCHSAKICKICIKIDKKEAIRRGGRACKKCGG